MTDPRLNEHIDSYVDFFVHQVGEPWLTVSATVEQLEAIESRMGPAWARVFERLGFSGFLNGRLWLTNPLTLEASVQEWVGGTPMEGLDDYLPFARGPFGDLRVVGLKSQHMFGIQCSQGLVAASPARQSEREIRRHDGLGGILGALGRRHQSISAMDDSDGEPLFDRVFDHLGPLGPDEVYLFQPGPPLIDASVERADKGRLDVFLSLQRELGGVRFVDLSAGPPA